MRKTLLVSSMALALASGASYAEQPVQNIASCEVTTADHLLAHPVLTESSLVGLVKDRITRCGNGAPAVVTTTIEAHPESAIAITLAAIDASPDEMAEIVAAAVAAAPDQAEAIVSSVTEELPTASGTSGAGSPAFVPARLPAGGSGGGTGGGTTASSS